MGLDRAAECSKEYPPTRNDDRNANERVAVLMLAERLFTVAEYAQLCADMNSGQVEIRRFDDGIVLVRNFPVAACL